MIITYSHTTLSCTILQPTPRMMLKLSICDTDVNFLYDPGTHVIIITKKVYDSLKSKSPLQSINKSGTGVYGSTFKYDGIVYFNINFGKVIPLRHIL